MPVRVNHNGFPGVPNVAKSASQFERFAEVIPIYEERNYLIAGVTKNSSGAPLGGCAVDLYDTVTDLREQTTVSDGSGNYSFVADKTRLWYVVAYLPGAPDVAGTTVNTLAPS